MAQPAEAPREIAHIPGTPTDAGPVGRPDVGYQGPPQLSKTAPARIEGGPVTPASGTSLSGGVVFDRGTEATGPGAILPSDTRPRAEHKDDQAPGTGDDDVVSGFSPQRGRAETTAAESSVTPEARRSKPPDESPTKHVNAQVTPQLLSVRDDIADEIFDGRKTSVLENGIQLVSLMYGNRHTRGGDSPVEELAGLIHAYKSESETLESELEARRATTSQLEEETRFKLPKTDDDVVPNAQLANGIPTDTYQLLRTAADTRFKEGGRKGRGNISAALRAGIELSALINGNESAAGTTDPAEALAAVMNRFGCEVTPDRLREDSVFVSIEQIPEAVPETPAEQPTTPVAKPEARREDTKAAAADEPAEKRVVRIDVRPVEADRPTMLTVISTFSNILMRHIHAHNALYRKEDVTTHLDVGDSQASAEGAERILRALGQAELADTLIRAHFPDDDGEIPHGPAWGQPDSYYFQSLGSGSTGAEWRVRSERAPGSPERAAESIADEHIERSERQKGQILREKRSDAGWLEAARRIFEALDAGDVLKAALERAARKQSRWLAISTGEYETRIDIEPVEVDRPTMVEVAKEFAQILSRHGHSLNYAYEVPTLSTHMDAKESENRAIGAARMLSALGQDELAEALIKAHFPDNDGKIQPGPAWAQEDLPTMTVGRFSPEPAESSA